MRRDLSDADVLTFALAGCNAAEVAAYAGTGEDAAQARIDHVLREHSGVVRVPPDTSRESHAQGGAP